jgi:hypothetical protein
VTLTLIEGAAKDIAGRIMIRSVKASQAFEGVKEGAFIGTSPFGIMAGIGSLLRPILNKEPSLFNR